MEDKANDATEPEESAETNAEPRETEGDSAVATGERPGAAGKPPNRFLARLGWTIGRGVGAIAGGAKWVGDGLQGSLSPDSGEPLTETAGEEGFDPGSAAGQPATEDGEAVDETAKKATKKSKKE